MSRAKDKAEKRTEMQEQIKGKVAVCVGCHRWFPDTMQRNAHRSQMSGNPKHRVARL